MATLDSLTSTYKAIEKTLHGFIKGYENAKIHNDPSLVNSHLAPDCQRRPLPSSFLKSLGAPPGITISNDMYQQNFATILPFHGIHKSDISNVTIDVWAKKAAATSVYRGKYSDGEAYSLDMAWYLTFNDDGTQVTDIVMFMDAIEQPKFKAKCDKLAEELKAKDEE
ncbi:uncharacterized protein CTRU02_204585 [Colletotrichum truncatum]|uniref:Uncharacterized protein n=1 Tax=Colletotrichum truncatum TaxID=5467 RepID=A0ACC3ZCG4_COLTU|nr:uncharacterized protein CTRU02_02815 [Colletotrichum truncatum]KAF6797773.1 hypothetical protein CTRU02_02815 [Colletotrichum truncatum]